MSTQAGSDLGRRITEQRKRAGLSRKQVADKAGMAPSYLDYLETSPAPNPSHGALTWLASALGTTSDALRGAGLEAPPGQRQAARHPVLEALSEAECRAYLAPGGVGRFLFMADRGPVAIPVNYRMLGADIVFRTGRATGEAAGAQLPRVSFDVDHLDDDLAEGWSVLVSGEAELITNPGELARAREAGITPWAGGDRDTYVRLTPREITGRRIRAGQ
jgi:transcriptional regulator with XRE-family HTH domain